MEGKYKAKWREAKLLAEQRWQDWEDTKMRTEENKNDQYRFLTFMGI